MTSEHALAQPLKPLYRGVSHLFGFFVVIGAAPVLVAFAPNVRASWAAAVYGLSLAAMFGFSALYHRTSPRFAVMKWLERLDHSAIFIFIAGSYTPFCLLLPDQTGMTLLVVVWTGAALGVLRALFWVDAPRWITVALYLLVGWTVVPFIPEFWTALGPMAMTLLFAGGVLYSVGAVVFARQKPDPWPGTFGYHEVWHVFVIVASLCHFVAVASAVKRMAGAE